MKRRLAAILAADVVGFSKMMGLDEAGTLASLKAFETETIQTALTDHDGRIVKRMGDGYIVEFDSVVAAIECALTWQSTPAGAIRFRIGINLGDVIVDDDDLYGDGVNIAARIEGIADAGSIYVSEDAWRYARGKVAATAEDLGEQHLKNIEQPIRVFRLLGDGQPTAEATSELPTEPLTYRSPRVLLTPFRHIGANTDAEALAAGLTETLAAALAHFEEFDLIDPGVGLRAVAADGGLEAGQKLHAHFLLEGTVQIAGQKVRIGVQLIDVETSHRVWSETHSREFEDAFDLQDDITAFVASTMGDAVGEERAKASAHKPLSDLSLDEAMLRGVQFLHLGGKDQVAQALAIFEKARASDTDSLMPTLCLGWCHILHVNFGWPLPRPDAFDHSDQLAQDLVRRYPRSAHAHRLRSFVARTGGDHAQALTHARRAYELNPWHADMMITLGSTLIMHGDTEEAIYHLERAFATNPYLPDPFKMYLSMGYFLAGRPEAGVEVLHASPQGVPPLKVARIVNLVDLDRLEEARKLAADLLQRVPKFSAEKFPARWGLQKKEDRDTVSSALRKAGLPG